MAKEKPDFRKVPDVQTSLADIKAFLNAVEKGKRTWPEGLRKLYEKAHFGCNFMIEVFDPELRYQTKALCTGELPRRPKPVIEKVADMTADPCPSGLPRRPVR